MGRLLRITSFSFLLFCCSSIRAQVPRSISYQGIATSNGHPLDGHHLITVTFYDAAVGGTKLFQETHDAEITGGVFDLTIGSVSPFPLTLAFDKPYFLGVSFDGNAEA